MPLSVLEAACRHVGVLGGVGGAASKVSAAHTFAVCGHARTIKVTPTPFHYHNKCVHAIKCGGCCVQARGLA